MSEASSSESTARTVPHPRPERSEDVDEHYAAGIPPYDVQSAIAAYDDRGDADRQDLPGRREDHALGRADRRRDPADLRGRELVQQRIRGECRPGAALAGRAEHPGVQD